MSDLKSLTIQLPLEYWTSLETQANQLNITPEHLATQLIQINLSQKTKIMSAYDALEGLRQLRQTLPSVDVVEIITASREELEQRGFF